MPSDQKHIYELLLKLLEYNMLEELHEQLELLIESEVRV